MAGKPLIVHVTDRISKLVDEIIVVVSSKSQKKNFEAVLKQKAITVIDKTESQSPLVGSMTGFENTQGIYSLLLPCDTPFVSAKIVQFLFDNSTNRNAIIARWPSGYIEPLQAVYRTKSALTAAKIALEKGYMNMRSMIENLTRVRYISTMVLEQIEPKMLTFFNINTPQDLEKAESLLS